MSKKQKSCINIEILGTIVYIFEHDWRNEVFWL